MQFITLKYFPLLLCFFSWDFWASEMISFVFIFEGKYRVRKRDRGGEHTFVTLNTLDAELIEGGRWGLCLWGRDRQEAVDALVNGLFGWLIPPHVFHLKMLICLDTPVHLSTPLVTSLKFPFHWVPKYRTPYSQELRWFLSYPPPSKLWV